MYIMKIKGGAKIPDYMQIRDDNFTLVAYFRADKIENGLTKFSLMQYFSEFENIVEKLNFGEMKYIKNID